MQRCRFSASYEPMIKLPAETFTIVSSSYLSRKQNRWLANNFNSYGTEAANPFCCDISLARMWRYRRWWPMNNTYATGFPFSNLPIGVT